MFEIEKKKIQSQMNLQKDISLFLKRRRIELGLKLEELSSGICSTSYLSRIENNQVDVDQTYFDALFEKMNINYESLKENRSRNLYHEILNAYIINDYEQIESIINHAIKSNNYIDTEIELFLLFFNIVTNNYEEARKILVKIDSNKKMLCANELVFYLFSFAYYTYKTNQNKKAYQQMLILNSINYDDVLMESCVYDLGIDIMEAVGEKVLSFNYYYNLEKIAVMPLFRERLLLHKIKIMIHNYEIDKEDIIKKILSFSKNIDFSKEYNRETYYYYLGLLYFYNKDYDEVVKLFNDGIYSARICVLYASCGLYTQNKEQAKSISYNINNYKFNKYETYFLDYCKFIKLYIDGNSDYVLLNYMKNILLLKSQFYFDFVELEKIKNFIPLLIGCGKYKEASREFIKYLEESKHKKLI